MDLSNEKDRNKDLKDWLIEEDPFGLEEEMEIVIFRCLDCDETDEVPEYVIGEFSVDLSKGKK